MQVLMGEFNGKSAFLPKLEQNQWGRMWASYGPAWAYDGEPWGFDNGAWSAFAKGTEFDEPRFLRRIQIATERQTHPPILAVVPDIVAGGVESFRFSLDWRQRLNSDWPWYLAVQDGMEVESVRRTLGQFDGLFLGGTDEFKRTAGKWCALAHSHGKRFHFGRCNRESWLRNAVEVGADSIDTTRPVREFAYGQKSWCRMFERIASGKSEQLTLW